MSVGSGYRAAVPRTARRPSFIEVLLVLGMLGLGYFAVTLDDTLWAGSIPETTSAPTEPVAR